MVLGGLEKKIEQRIQGRIGPLEVKMGTMIKKLDKMIEILSRIEKLLEKSK